MEMALVADLIMSGALAHVDNVHVDWSLPDNEPEETANKTRNFV